jgi:hypothetical protein
MLKYYLKIVLRVFVFKFKFTYRYRKGLVKKNKKKYFMLLYFQ